MSATEYRYPEDKDIEALALLGAETFEESHGEQYEQDDLDAFVTAVFSEQAVRTEWQDRRYAFWIAQSEEGLVDYCKLGPASEEIACNLELKQIFVRKALYGSQVGKKLIEWAFDEAARRDIRRLGLSVWEGNGRAIRFYEKHGFVQTGTMKFVVGEKVERDIVMNRSIP